MTFLICSLGGRSESLSRLLASLKPYADFGWDVDVVLQAYSTEERDTVERALQEAFPQRACIYATPAMTGPHLARCIALDSHAADVWCILDDDMYAVEGFTDYNAMAYRLTETRGIGLLSSNWRKTENQLRAQVSVRDAMVRQDIVYTGGGMMLREPVAEIIRRISRQQYLFDNPLWSIYAYVNGYSNYRYLGSASVHNICATGGRRKWIAETDTSKALPPAAWITTRRGKPTKTGFNEYLIPTSADVTDKAKQLHYINRKG